MTQTELLKRCSFVLATPEKMAEVYPFSCGDNEDQQDLNEFFAKDAVGFHNRLLGKTYYFCLNEDTKRVVTAFTVSNDSLRMTNKLAEEYRDRFLEETDLRDKHIKRFPGVLLGRLATDARFAGQGFGTAVMDFIKLFFRRNNKTGCRFIIVDALNNEGTLSFYKKNGFDYLIEDERLEAKYVGVGVGRMPLNTRLLYFDLLTLQS